MKTLKNTLNKLSSQEIALIISTIVLTLVFTYMYTNFGFRNF